MGGRRPSVKPVGKPLGGGQRPGSSPRSLPNKEGAGDGRSTPDGEKNESPAPARATYGIQDKKKRKKQVVEEVVEEPSPFKNAPMMITLVPLVAREAKEVDSPPVGAKVVTGSLVRVAETAEVGGFTRKYIALDGDVEALGWVTAVGKDGIEHIYMYTHMYIYTYTHTHMCTGG